MKLEGGERRLAVESQCFRKCLQKIEANVVSQFFSCRPGPSEVQLSRALEKAIRRSEVVDRESLCILAGQKVSSMYISVAHLLLLRSDESSAQVWQIRLDVHCLNDEGNLLDCASVACVAALRHFRKPEVTIEGTEVTVVSWRPASCYALSAIILILHSCSTRLRNEYLYHYHYITRHTAYHLRHSAQCRLIQSLRRPSTDLSRCY